MLSITLVVGNSGSFLSPPLEVEAIVSQAMLFFFSQEGVSSVLLPATAVYSRSGMVGAYTGHVQLVEVDWEGPGVQPSQATAKDNLGVTAEDIEVRFHLVRFVWLFVCLYVESSNRSCLGDFHGHLSTHRTGQKSKRKKLGPQL